jgi:hypothetical protein
MKRVFMTRHFSRWLSKTDLSIEALCGAVEEMERGLVDANLGGGILKKRVALPGRGKRGSTRTLVATNTVNRWFFVFGFEKTDRDNINAKELSALKALASDLLRLGVSELSAALAAKTLQEICHEN